MPPRRSFAVAVLLASLASACAEVGDEPVDPRVTEAASARRADRLSPEKLPCPGPVAEGDACGLPGSECVDVRTCGAPEYACIDGAWTVTSRSFCDAPRDDCPAAEPPADGWCPKALVCSYGARTYACRGSRWAAELDAGADSGDHVE